MTSGEQEIWNQALDWAAENATTTLVEVTTFDGPDKMGDVRKWSFMKTVVDKESILKGKVNTKD